MGDVVFNTGTLRENYKNRNTLRLIVNGKGKLIDFSGVRSLKKSE